MVELLDFIMGLLCQQGTLSDCQQFVSGYSDPVQQVLFFLFFPTIFVLLFIIFLTEGVLHNNSVSKFKVLLGVAFFVFIVVQGWYHYFLSFGTYWFMTVIILGGFFVITQKMGAAGGGGGDQGGRTAKKGAHWAKRAVFGTDSIDPRELIGRKKEAARAIKDLKDEIDILEKDRKDLPKEDERGRAEITKMVSERKIKLEEWKHYSKGAKKGD